MLRKLKVHSVHDAVDIGDCLLQMCTYKHIGNKWCTQNSCKLDFSTDRHIDLLIDSAGVIVMNVMYIEKVLIVIYYHHFAIVVLVHPVVRVVLIYECIVKIVSFELITCRISITATLSSRRTITITLHATCVVAAREVLSC